MHKLVGAVALALALQFVGAVPAFAVVNINTATKEELVALNGIGPAKAQAILDYRKANGPFKSVDDLRNVKGIGAKRLEKLRPELAVAAAPAKSEARGAGPSAKGDVKTPTESRTKP
jgi:competence protein ComEA